MDNGDRTRLRELERRMDNLEPIVPALAELRGTVLTKLDAIQSDLDKQQRAQKEERQATLAEKGLLIGAGGVVLAAIIGAIAQLAGG